MTQQTARDMGRAMWSMTKAGLMAVGLAAVITWQAPLADKLPGAAETTAPALTGPLDAILPANISADTAALADRVAAPDPAGPDPAGPEHRRVADYLARKYRVALDVTQSIVVSAYSSAREIGVDPALVLAVMGIESRLNPLAASPMGAVGLMQIIPRYHADKLEEMGGVEAALNPAANIRVGAMILKDYLRRFGSLEAGLKAYSGATADDFGYAAKVIAERDRIQAVAAGGRAGAAAGGPATPVPAVAPARRGEAAPPAAPRTAPEEVIDAAFGRACGPQYPAACPSLRESDAAT